MNLVEIKPWTALIKCVCSSHMLEIEKDDESNHYYMTMWYRGTIMKTPWTKFKDRIRTAWRVLFYGQACLESVILTEEEFNKAIKSMEAIKER